MKIAKNTVVEFHYALTDANGEIKTVTRESLKQGGGQGGKK